MLISFFFCCCEDPEKCEEQRNEILNVHRIHTQEAKECADIEYLYEVDYDRFLFCFCICWFGLAWLLDCMFVCLFVWL